MATSFKRKCFEIRRLLKNKLFALFIFTFAFFACFFILKSKKSFYLSKFHPKELYLNFSNLPGDADPNTVFVGNELGNFENNPNFEKNPSDLPGENGSPIYTNLESPEVRRAMSEYGFNVIASDKALLNRSIPDVRMEECKHWNYPEDLPTVSVVIAFHNEGWSPLLRTLHSVLLRSPSHLLTEVLLVDDFSSKEHLKEKLNEYIKQFGDRVKLLRNTEREGLIRTRTNGALAARGEVVIFLDAHCEVNHNWLPPLLAPIKYNKKVMTVPVIDGIDMKTWEYRSVYGEADRHFRGIFEWGLLYKETKLPENEKKLRSKNSQPFRSPTHAGGLFAINRDWFASLGYYDSGLQIWGGEQYELSFKIWQCGGGILFVPCSHVGHVYRSHMPYDFGKLSGKPVISINLIRVIKTWMDDYSKYYYIREPQAKYREPGDISSQLALREKYVKNVAYDVLNSYPLLPENYVWGEAKNLITGKCIDTFGRAIPGILGASSCHGFGGNQLIRLNKKGQLTQGEWCITPYGSEVRTGHCTKGTIDGPFFYDRKTKQIRVNNSMGLVHCLSVDEELSKSGLTIVACDDSSLYQKFVWTEKYS